MKRQLTPEEAQQELERRFKSACEKVTSAEIANGHDYQLAVLECQSLAILLMCSRRAGKSRVCCGLLLKTAIKTDGSSSLYLALTKGQAEKIWRKHWKPMLRKFKLFDMCSVSDSTMVTTFPNGARVVFGGTDDMRTVTHLLGDSMAGGIAILDEQQDDPGLLEEVATTIIGPMIAESTSDIGIPGRIVIAGTVPKMQAGYFIKLWEQNYDDAKGEHKEDAEWKCFSWSRFDNPHEKDNEWHLEVHLRRYKLDRDDPSVQRDWFGRRIWDITEVCFGYRKEINQWDAPHLIVETMEPFKTIAVAPPKGKNIDCLWIGIDPAQSVHRFAIEGFGTSSQFDNGAWHLFEAVTEKGGDPWETQWLSVIKWAKAAYGFMGLRLVRVIRDPGSSSETNDVLLRSHGTLIEAAIKGPGSLKGRVEHVRDMNMTGELHTLKGTELEEDFIKTKWSKKEREKGHWEYDGSWHPDPADASTYILPAYTASKRQPLTAVEGQSEEQLDAAAARRAFVERYTKPRRTEPKKPPRLYPKSGFFRGV